MLETKNLDIIIGTRYLIKNLSFALNKNEFKKKIDRMNLGESNIAIMEEVYNQLQQALLS